MRSGVALLPGQVRRGRQPESFDELTCSVELVGDVEFGSPAAAGTLMMSITNDARRLLAHQPLT
jgi:hypothetical protein